MIFALTNAPYKYVTMMNLVLGPLHYKVCCCYLDDAIIPGRDCLANWQMERLNHIIRVFHESIVNFNLKKW